MWVKKCVEMYEMLFKNWKWLFENTKQIPSSLTLIFWQNGGAHPSSLHRTVTWPHIFLLCHAYHKTQTETHKPKIPSHATNNAIIVQTQQAIHRRRVWNPLLSKLAHSTHSKTNPWTRPSCQESARLLRWIGFQRE